MKVKAKLYRGIEYVEIDDLPEYQQKLLSEKADIELIKILIDNKVISNCLQYCQYSQWYETVFKVEREKVVLNAQTPQLLEPVKVLVNR
jgi:hypothetical protein